ncbi:ADP-ribosylglycohydrolase family protein [Nitratireductor aquimarinus]|uniref:ADP-ribosylglycohydrolase family protein n=1 Tax=Alphaproteobacteria TaxID=28211 RepID=UPI0019D37D57|nr:MULTISPECIES: ADP-ribosylglycohydrolase family protein [Alphaproteobacteria]MBN7759429.1 ADP-ribosylglycohydrolase family protein [Nitratireductor aquimarinus]MBY6002224.1 ADP-ribosylglycohydrolase family protein [Tritonibacter mobilis]MBY6024680.1 ADP-ribosylglycohydrolase family protein [Nitratireductor sp. DP7N14-4]
MTPESIREKIYAGLIGKAVGVRLGAPVEPTVWTEKLIREVYGEIDDYVRDYRNFAADDDTNGPLFFVRALWDEGDELTYESAGRTWLNYIGDGHGMLWWGGFNISTEETAYRYLQDGVTAPTSGSIKLRGQIEAEQIGGQIFSDCWGWVCPGKPEEAARLARIMASVSHDGEALHGAAYVAGATAAAFTASTIAEVHETARALVADGSHYARVLDAVSAYHAANPEDWRGCFHMLERDFGYDKWTGVCHVIPNAGVTALALLYGEGDMPRTAAVASMCGWDTDCNAGNAANIAGVLQGVQPHWAKWRRPINDILITSAVTGSLNIVDMPSAARDFAVLALRRRGDAIPEGWADKALARAVDFDFALPGASHGIRAEGSHRLRTLPGNAEGAITVQIDRWAAGDNGRVFWKPFYRECEFDDNRYRPMLSPVTASGQRVEISLTGTEALEGPRQVTFVPYVRFAASGEVRELGDWSLLPEDWQVIGFTLPDSEEAIDEIGILMKQTAEARVFMNVLIRSFTVTGAGKTVINPQIESEEWGSVSRFSFNRGSWGLSEGCIRGEATKDGDLWTGHAFATDQTATAQISRVEGESHLVSVRASGNERFYAAGIHEGQAVILREDFGTEILAAAPVEVGQDVTLTFAAKGERLTLFIDGREIVSATDSRHPRGMAGLRLGGPGVVTCRRFEILEG